MRLTCICVTSCIRHWAEQQIFKKTFLPFAHRNNDVLWNIIGSNWAEITEFGAFPLFLWCLSDHRGNSSALFPSLLLEGESLCAAFVTPSGFFFVPRACSLCCKLLQSRQTGEMLLSTLWPPVPPLLSSAPTPPPFLSPCPLWLPLALVDLLFWTTFSLNSCQSPYEDLQRDLRARLLKGWFSNKSGVHVVRCAVRCKRWNGVRCFCSFCPLLKSPADNYEQ